MASFQLRNDSRFKILLADMGLPISAGELLTFDTEEPFFETIVYSDNLKTYVNSGNIVLVYDSSDLSISNALNFLSFESGYLDDLEEANSGGAWETGSTPPSSPSTGDGWYRTTDGILYIWNGSKWLSSSKHIYTLTRPNRLDGSYLYSGDLPNSDVSGVSLTRDATITAVNIKAYGGNSNKGCSFEIDYNWLLDFYVVNYIYSNTSLNYDLDAGEIFMIYAWRSGSALVDVIAQVEYAWRYSV